MTLNNNSHPENISNTENSPSKTPNFSLNNPIMNILQQKKVDLSMASFVQAKQEAELKKLSEERRAKKLEILKNDMNMSESDAKNRPTLADLDENILRNIDTASDAELQNIIAFMARHNIACALGCCGDKTPPERIQEIADIYNRRFGDKFLHFHLYQESHWTQDDWKKAIEADTEEALEYFQIYLKDAPQSTEERKNLLQEFADIYFLAQKQSQQ